LIDDHGLPIREIPRSIKTERAKGDLMTELLQTATAPAAALAFAFAPFKDWVLPAAIERVRRKLTAVDDGNRQMVDILIAVPTDGGAWVEAIVHGVHSADVVLNIPARQRDPAPPANRVLVRLPVPLGRFQCRHRGLADRRGLHRQPVRLL